MINHKPFLDYNQIQSGIYIGNIQAAQNNELLDKLKVNAILTVDIYPLPDEIIRRLTHYLHINLKDDEKEDLISNFDVCYSFIQKCLDEKVNLLIHCVAGLSRSPAVLISYLMKANKLNFDQAFEQIKKKRKICCNEGFKYQLNLYHEMNWSLDINYRPYRLLSLSSLTHSVNRYLLDITNPNSMNKLKSQINTYLTKFHDNNCLNSGKIVFKCKKCRLYLFNEINVLTNSTSNSLNANSSDLYNNLMNTNCGSIYIEPIPCISNEIYSSSGILNCTNCFSRIGKFNWIYGIDCAVDCVKHCKIIPAFKIDSKKIDHHIL